MFTQMMNGSKKLYVHNWHLLRYGDALSAQKTLVKNRLAGREPDSLVFVEHPPVATIGRSGDTCDLRVSKEVLNIKGIELFFTDRGGRATFHGPGQMVVYPIIKLEHHDLHWYVHTLLKCLSSVLRTFGLEPVEKDGSPGLWVNGAKIASIGISVNKWVTYHGIALNVHPDLTAFNWIISCGQPAEKITSMEKELVQTVDMQEVMALFEAEFRESFGYTNKIRNGRPDWLKLVSPNSTQIDRMEQLIGDLRLSTVCQSAHCPNLGECFSRGTATFMILGDRCTRNCSFCAVAHAPHEPLDEGESQRVASAVKRLGLKYVVITSVTRDDLPDGGAGQFVRTMTCIRDLCPGTMIEILVPDFKGSIQALDMVCNARPEMFNHNIETVPRLYPRVRPQASFELSLKVLEFAAEQGLEVKSGLMLGLGEQSDEITNTLLELQRSGCDHLTLGQYLSPSERHVPVARYVQPEEFDMWAEKAKAIGFKEVTAGPLIRSSYKAEEMVKKSKTKCTGNDIWTEEGSSSNWGEESIYMARM